LLRPWAAIVAGEENPAGQPRLSGGDRLTLAFSQANRALALEHAKRPTMRKRPIRVCRPLA